MHFNCARAVRFAVFPGTKALSLFVILLSALPLSSQAVSISAFRIYLDSDKPTSSFTIHNQDVQAQDCELKLTHYTFGPNSEIYNVAADDLPANSAQDWIRFSPKEFQLTPANSQTIRFSLRRKANSEAAEYRSYLVVDCGVAKKIGEEETLINIKPKLLHNVPIIVRTGKLEADISIANVKEEDESLTFSVERTGSRSVYADVELINTSNDEVITSQTGFSIYPESERYLFKLGRMGVSLENIKLRVTENIHYGGNIVFERSALDIIQEAKTQ